MRATVSLLDRALFATSIADHEKLYMVVHRHPIFVFGLILKYNLFGVAPVLAAWYFFPQYLLWYLPVLAVVYGLLLYRLADWYFDCWLVTNQGIIAVKWDGFAQRSAYHLNYGAIEGIMDQQSGWRPRLWGYGDLHLVKMGDSNTILLSGARNVQWVARAIMDHKDISIREHQMQEEEAIKDILSGIISRHVEKHGVSLGSHR